MQLLKITTTPIKYRVETERASFTLADSDNYDSSGVLQGGIKKVDATNNYQPLKIHQQLTNGHLKDCSH